MNTPTNVEQNTPTSPNDWHAKSFRDAAFWREESEKWERLSAAAEADQDERHAKYCSENAADCRHNARILESATPSPPASASKDSEEKKT